MPQKLKIASVSAELSPFTKTGGLADVAGSLPKAFFEQGAEVICITPFYAQAIDREKFELKLIGENVELRINSEETVNVSYWQGWLEEGLPVYFIENAKYFSRKKELYGSQHENARFFVFDLAALKLLSLLKFSADIIHCHDWQAGLIPYFLKTDFRYSDTLAKTKTVYTIHNLVFQLGHDWWEVPAEKRDSGHTPLPLLADPDLEFINFAKRAILSADAITTVSETYREEIMTNESGEDLHRILTNRQDRFFGIVNGINEAAWNPDNDPGLYCNYSRKNFSLKEENKKSFQKKFGLTVDTGLPIACGTSRMTFQKGFELILETLPHLLELDLQIVLIGACGKEYLGRLKKIANQHPKKILLLPTHEDCMKYETFAYAASDFFLMPSEYEPCGLNQMIAMRYGCVPIVHRVGGLNDTVNDYNPVTGRGTGFAFDRSDSYQFYGAVIRAMEEYGHKERWKKIVAEIMEKSNAWEIPAKKYLKLFRKIIKS
ncbi:MAG: glycogen/starch synthase [Patescibacteria group bacterium]|nr:glycogen/starch synthase [Patescibacteria group bacterium]